MWGGMGRGKWGETRVQGTGMRAPETEGSLQREPTAEEVDVSSGQRNTPESK